MSRPAKPQKKRTAARRPPVQPSISIGSISKVRGNVNVSYGDIFNGLDVHDVQALMRQYRTALDDVQDIPSSTREQLAQEVQEIEAQVLTAAQTQKPLDEKKVASRFRNIARMAPDILLTAVTTLGSPLAGLALVAEKIAEKAKQDGSGTG